jgi:hypothetical protein
LTFSSNFFFLFRPIIGENFTFTIEGAKDSLLMPLNVLVLGRSGLIYSNNHPEANDLNKVELSIPITREMAPKADLVVFYLREQDGAPVYDTVKISTTFGCDTRVSKLITSESKSTNHFTSA